MHGTEHDNDRSNISVSCDGLHAPRAALCKQWQNMGKNDFFHVTGDLVLCLEGKYLLNHLALVSATVPMLSGTSCF